MATPGWYPDPAGHPNTYRYWDGQAWSAETSPSPYVAPPGSAPPPPPPGAPPSQPPGQESTQPPDRPAAQPTQPPAQRPPQPPTQSPGPPPAQPGLGGYTGYGGGSGWAPMSAPPGSGGSGAGKTVLLVVLVVLLLVGVGVGGFFGVRALTGDDGTGSDESSQATDEPDEGDEPTDDEGDGPEALLETCTAGEPDGGATVGEKMRGGGLVMPTPSGYSPKGWEGIKQAFTFADKVALAAQEIQKDKWIANYALAGLPTTPDYSGLDQAAESVLECMTNSTGFFENFESRDDLTAEGTEVAGHDAFRLVSEIRVEDPELSVDGDQVSVVVVDTGDDGGYGLYISVVPLGDDELIKQEEQTFQKLAVGSGSGDTA